MTGTWKVKDRLGNKTEATPFTCHNRPNGTNVETTETECPTPRTRPGYVMRNSQTGETRQGARCGRNTCPYCLGINAKRRGLAQSWALLHCGTYVRHGTLTLVADPDTPLGDVWQTVRTRVKLIMRNVERLGSTFGEYTYTVEQNPQGTGYHAHFLQHGPDRLDLELLNEAAHRAHAGNTSGVTLVRSIDKATAYNLKSATYNLKGMSADGPEIALLINGGRLEHHSRNFYPDATVHRAEVNALSDFLGETPNTWTWVPRG